MPDLALRSPAKLNLYLKIQNKRSDGFHNILTLFERISLADELRFVSSKNPSIQIQCDHPHVPTGPKNLVFKAIKLLQSELGVKQGMKVHIKKNIPVAAGLGGGSSNAATTLLALNQLWSLKLSKKKMQNYALQLGSDVPFFLFNASWATGEGRGEQIREINIKSKYWHILVVPKVKVYTQKVYEGLKINPELTRNNSLNDKMRGPNGIKGGATNLLTKMRDNVNILIHNLMDSNILESCVIFENDLETVAIKLCPSIGRLQQRLKLLGAKGVMVSGSGPSVFGLTESKSEAEIIKAELSKRYQRVFVVRTL